MSFVHNLHRSQEVTRDECRLVVATVDDCEDIVRMTLNVELEADKLSGDRRSVETGVATVLACGGREGFYLVAKSGERAVAQVLVQELPVNPSHGGGVFWQVDDIYVEVAFRKTGLVQQMLKWVEDRAQATDGCLGLQLIVLLSNERAQRSYRRSGLGADGHVLMRKLFSGS